MDSLILRATGIGDTILIAPWALALARSGWDVSWLASPAAKELLEPLEGVAFVTRSEAEALRPQTTILLQQPQHPILLHGEVLRASAGEQHLFDTFGAPFRALGVARPSPRLGLSFPPCSRREHVVLCPGSTHLQKTMPVEQVKAVVQFLQGWNHEVVLCGGAAEAERYHEVTCEKLCGAGTLKAFASLLSAATLCISVDSFSLHLACALGVKMLGIFYASDWRRSGAVEGGSYVSSYNEALGFGVYPRLGKAIEDSEIFEKIILALPL